MSKLELNQIYLQLEREINHVSQSFTCCFKNSIKEDAHDVILEIKSEIDNWETKLNEREIACYELEDLVKSKCSKIKLSRMEIKCRTSEELDAFKNVICGLISKAIMNAYFHTRFDLSSSMNERRVFEKYQIHNYFV
jgi:hypothetical protein